MKLNAQEKVRTAMIGLGGSAERILLPGLTTLPEIQLVAGCDLDKMIRDHATKKWKLPKVYAEPDEMIAQEQPEVVVVATPPLTHRELCLLALEHGCHVFCEKPFMPSVEDADCVIAVAEAKQRLIAVNNQYYHMPIYRKTKEYLDSGQSGRLYHIEVWQHMYLLPSEEGGWKAALQPRRVLYEFGTHAIDLICHFFEAYPEAVTARMPKVRVDVEADVCIIMRLDFPGDRVANMVLNRMSYAPIKYLEMRLDCEKMALRTSLGGVARWEFDWNSKLGRPNLRFSLTRGGEARLERNGQSRLLIQQSRAAFAQAATTHFSQFIAALKAGREPIRSATHAREILRAVFAGYHSVAAGGEVVRLG